MPILKCFLISLILINGYAKGSQGSSSEFSDEEEFSKKKKNSPFSVIQIENFAETKFIETGKFIDTGKNIELSNSSREIRKFVEKGKDTTIDIEVPAPVLLSGGPIRKEKPDKDSSSKKKTYPLETDQQKKKSRKEPQIKLSNSTASDKDNSSSKLIKLEKAEKPLVQPGKKSSLELEGNSSNIEDVVEIEGVLDSKKKKLLLLETSTHLSLYGIRTLERIKDSSYFEKSSLNISPKTINPNVISLRLHLCMLQDYNITQIGNFKKLEKLELPANKITDVGVNYITQISQLKTLDLSLNSITDKSMKKIAQLLHLETLNLSLNEGVTDKGIEELNHHPRLKNLIIKITSVSRNKYEEISKWGLTELTYYPPN